MCAVGLGGKPDKICINKEKICASLKNTISRGSHVMFLDGFKSQQIRINIDREENKAREFKKQITDINNKYPGGVFFIIMLVIH